MGRQTRNVALPRENPKGENRGVVPERPNRSMDVVLLHRHQITETWEKTGVFKRAPEGGILGGIDRTVGRSWRLLQDYLVKEVSVGKPPWGEHGAAAFRLLTRGGIGTRQDSSVAKKAHIDDFDGFRHSDKSCALGWGSHAGV